MLCWRQNKTKQWEYKNSRNDVTIARTGESTKALYPFFPGGIRQTQACENYACMRGRLKLEQWPPVRFPLSFAFLGWCILFCSLLFLSRSLRFRRGSLLGRNLLFRCFRFSYFNGPVANHISKNVSDSNSLSLCVFRFFLRFLDFCDFFSDNFYFYFRSKKSFRLSRCPFVIISPMTERTKRANA